MAGSDSSVRGGHCGDEEPPVSQAEMHQMTNSLVEAMERMFDVCLPAAGGRGPHRHHEENHRAESVGENSGFGHGFDRFGDGRGGRRGGRRADFDHQHGGCHANGRRVCFEDEEFDDFDHDEGFDDNENPFGDDGLYGRCCDRRRCADHEDREHHRGRRHRDDPDNIARVKLKILKFTGKEDVDAYFEWAEQCDQIFRVHNLSDQRHVNLASVEFSGYALTWWNQVQENQLELGRDYINNWAELKRVMRRRFVPSSYQRDLRNRLQVLKQGKRTVDKYYKEMELLLVRAEIREDPE
jgi:hypothetical protein